MAFDQINEELFKLGDLGTFASRDVTQSITSMSTSLTLSGSSQVSVDVLDPNFGFAKANYFLIRRDIFYRNIWFEIAAVETSRSEAVHPQYSLECRSKAVQLMKRDKKPEAFRGMTGYDFAQAMAKRFAMKFVGEKTTKKQAIVKGKSKNSDDSVWTVLQSLAGEQKFICFESENTLFFCSEKFLLGKWGDPAFKYGEFTFIPLIWPEPSDTMLPSAKGKYLLLEQPRLRRSDDDIKAAEGSAIVDRTNGVNLRPGQTIFFSGIPDFEGFYLITDVSFREGTPEPVQITFRVPVDPEKEKISTNGTLQGSRTTTGSGNTGATPPPGTGTTRQIPKTITPEGGVTYARSALAYMRYRGNASVMIGIVVKGAVNSIKKGTVFETVIKNISNDKRLLTNNDRLIAKNIFTAYIAGYPAQKFAVSGGVSADAMAGAANKATAQYGASTTSSNPTPTKTATFSYVKADASDATSSVKATTPVAGPATILGEGVTAGTSTLNPRRDSLPNSIAQALSAAVAKYAPTGVDTAMRVKALNNLKAKALTIYTTSDILNKRSLMNSYYREFGDKTQRWKYNCLYDVWSLVAGTTIGFSGLMNKYELGG